MQNKYFAPGWPGIPPRWTSSAKSGVGTALSSLSRVWFTISHGIFDEIYYPRLDQACIRDTGLIITDGKDFFSEEKRHTKHEIILMTPGVPAYKVINTCLEGRYQIQKEIITDPQRDVLLQQTHFIPMNGLLNDYHLYVLLAPHIGNRGSSNNAWIGEFKGNQMLFAEREGYALALACSTPWLNRSTGFVGTSDGWQDLNQHKLMTWSYERADNGNVALTGEVDLSACKGDFIIGIGFGLNYAEAAQRVMASLSDGFATARDTYIRQWTDWQQTLQNKENPHKVENKHNLFEYSMAVIRTHESKRFPGGIIASLSIPWGYAKGDDDLGGYHLVWPRDLVETAGGLLAGGAHEDARHVLFFLQVTQEADGHWPQNMWLDGRPYWSGIQMDETAFPILLVDLAKREKALLPEDMKRLWPMVKRAASFLVKNGPVTPQDRWEEDPGFSPFTLAVEISALLAAADLADLNQEPSVSSYLRETADAWNAGIERWVYVTGTDLAQMAGVEGYYVRIAPPEIADAASPARGFVPIKNHAPIQSSAPVVEIISPDALALVRFGLRSPDDPRIRNTVKVIDELLKVETPFGPSWHRYNEDGYGEHQNGDDFDGSGIGRAWPLLTGERAHYELSAKREDEALRLLRTLENFSNEVGLLPEQIWDCADIPERELFFGKPTGSAMPLVWAHAEYIKLHRSLGDGHVFDMPDQTVQRYIKQKTETPYTIWRFNHKCQTMPAGKILRLEVMEPALVHWSANDWGTVQDLKTKDTGLGMHVTDLPTRSLPAGTCIVFTFYWTEQKRWEEMIMQVTIDSQK